MDRETLVKLLTENDFVAVTYRKANGEVTTRTATIRQRPESDAPKGVREPSESVFRYYEWGRENRFDPSAPGDWASFKMANLISAVPTKG